ncbi:MAG: malate dehydrogenase, partial [Desulfobacula sp.]|nr:malate dehydrogenase [Desulfobacula sp.]
TNPIDVMVGQLQKASGIADNMIIGMAGVLDSARFRTFLAQELNVSVDQVQAFVVGGHGDSMVPLTGMSNVAGITLEALVEQGKISRERLDQIVERTQKGGGEIVAHLKTGSAYYTPATAAVAMAEAYLYDKLNIYPCAVKVSDGKYGINEPLFVGLPTKIGGKGVAEIIEVPLTENERKKLQISIDLVRELNSTVEKL